MLSILIRSIQLPCPFVVYKELYPSTKYEKIKKFCRIISNQQLFAILKEASKNPSFLSYY
jgi:hypothetical protein